MKNIKMFLSLMIGILFITTTISNLYYGSLQVRGIPENPIVVEEGVRYTFSLSDRYDEEGYSLDGFLQRSGVLEDLQDINEALNNSENFTYYQVNSPSIYYLGNFDGPVDLIVEGEAGRNQSQLVNGDRGTSLSSMEVSQTVLQENDLVMESGRGFSDEDFDHTYRDVIPVILGNDYKGFLKPGDTIRLSYYLDEIDVLVVGILKKKSVIMVGTVGTEVDPFIIFPDVKIAKKSGAPDMHNVIMMLEKDEGVIGINDLDEFPKVLEELKKIGETYDFAINLDKLERAYERKKELEAISGESDNRKESSALDANEAAQMNLNMPISSKEKGVSILLLIAGVFCVFVFLLRYVKVLQKKELKERKVVLDTKNILCFASYMLISYMISYFCTIKLIVFRYGNLQEGVFAYSQAWVRLILLLLLIIGSVVIAFFTPRSKIQDNKGGV